MALGSLLLQPQALDRLQTLDETQALADDILALLHLTLVNPNHAESVAPAFQRAFEAMGERLQSRLEPRLERALEELRAIIQPLLSQVQAIADEGEELDSAGDVLGLASTLVEQLLKLAESLSEAELRAFAGRIQGLLGDTLGLNQALFKEELRQVFAQVRSELLDGVHALASDRAAIHLALAALLGRLEEELFAQWQSLDLNPDRLAQLVMQALARSGFEKLRTQFACLLEKLQAALRAGGNIVELAKPSIFDSGSVGSAQPRPPLSGDKFCWYASWLYGTRRREIGDFGYWLASQLPGFPNDEVWLSEDRTQLILRKALRDAEILHQASGGLDWKTAPQFTSASGTECFTFGVVSADFLETWTQVFDALRDFGKGGAHVIACATSPKEYAANIPLIVWNWSKMLSTGLAQAPLTSFLNNRAGWNVGSQWMYILVPWLSVILGSLEGKHTETNATNKFLQWLTLLGGDALNAFTIDALASGIHNVMLSLWTLMNYQGPAGKSGDEDTRPRNREYGGPIIGLSVTGAGMLLMKLLPREDYAHPFFKGNNKFYLYWLVYAPLMGAAGGLLGTLLTWAISRTYDWGQFAKEIGLGALQGWASFILQQYSGMEGDTKGGKYNPTLDKDGNTYSPARQAFAGYPPGDSSPYRLPYAQGKALYVGQANQGMFSHMRFNSLPQIYAYDFAHDFGEEILAARAGTVVDFFDWIDDDIEPNTSQMAAALTAARLVMGATWRNTDPYYCSWNYIVIRHDTQNADHDKDQGGTVVTTYAVYGHGKQGSIRELFNGRGVAPGAIIGTTVQQGQPIMLAGDTGVSFHNHLHMHVLGHVTGGSNPTPAAPPIWPSQLSPYTLPFVFREARHVLKPDGVLQYLTWYKSDNERIA
jgi:hypothetical protein